MCPEEPEKSILRFGPFELDAKTGELHRDGVRVKLQPQPSRVLTLLASRAGHLVTRVEIQQEVWGSETYVDFEHGLNFCIRQIRAALGDDNDTPRYIETVPRRGYRFVAAVGEPNGAMTSRATGEAMNRHPSSRTGRRAAWPIAIMAALLVLLAGYILRPRLSTREQQHPGKVVLAVLPFADLSGQAEGEYFSDGLTDELITQLGSLHRERLTVIARTSTMKYKNTADPADKIGRALGAAFLVEGSVRSAGGLARINVQLIDARTQTHLWAKTYERHLRDFLAVQSEVARDISSEIELKLSPQQEARLARWRSADPKAHEAYLRGRYFWNQRTEEGFLKARGYFEQAIEDDPGYPLAYAGLADAYIGLGEYGVLPLNEAMPRAKAAAIKALEIDDTLAEAHASLGGILCDFDWDWPAAEREFKRAIELNPAYATAHQWYAEYLLWMGRFEESKAEMQRAQELDPLSLIITRNLGLPYFYARQYDEAIAHFRKTLEIDPNFWAGHFILGWTYEQKRDFAQAIEEYKLASRLHDVPLTLAHLGHVYAVSGKRREAENLLAELKARSKRRHVSPLDIALIYAGLGDKDQALEWLGKGFEERSDRMVQLGGDPRWDNLRSDPRFQELVRRVGLPP